MIKLHEAILNGDLPEVKRILEIDPPLIDAVDEDGICMTFIAAKTGNEDVVRYIVEYSRASFNIVDKDNRNTLHYAAMSGNTAQPPAQSVLPEPEWGFPADSRSRFPRRSGQPIRRN